MTIRIQTKLALLVGFVILSFLSGMTVLYRSELAKVRDIMASRQEEKAVLVDELVTLYSAPSRTLAYDYSFWDETVNFVGHPNTTWAQENIDVALGTFQSTAAWVYDTRFRLVYVGVDNRYTSLGGDTTLSHTITGAVSRRWFNHFFASTSLGVVEIFTAPIQPSADSRREADPSGYFAVGRLLDSDYTRKIEAIAEVAISVELRDTSTSDASTGTISVSEPLTGSEGDTVAFLHGSARDPLYDTYARSSRASLIGMLASGGTLFALLFIAMYVWLSRPLQRISSALEHGDVALVNPLANTRSEFGQVARLIRDFFEQKSELERQIEAHVDARKALTDSDYRYQVMAEQTGQMVYDWDMGSGHIHWAGAIEAITQFSGEEYRSVDIAEWEQMIHPEDREGIMASLDHAARTGRRFGAEYRLLRRDGTYVMVENSGVFIRTTQGKAVQMLGTMRDITDRKQAEAHNRSLQDKLERAQRMESLAVLAGGVAHDLNNMLGPVVGYSELLLKTIPPDSKASTQLKRILKAARDAADVIQDLLTLARRGRYERKPLSLNEAIGSFLESTGFSRLRERHPNVVMKSQLTDQIGLILGSRTHLEKVLMNLVANGCEAMPEGGTLTIETEERPLEALLSGSGHIEPGHYVLLRVKDTGRGIDSRDLSRIFEPYFSKKQLGHSGSGLGLSVVYGVVKDHGGYYDVFSELGKGTEFILYFPICGASTGLEEHDETATVGGTESVLVIDDSQDQREMACDMISSLGYQVHACASGREAVAFIKTRSVDVLVLDMIMEPDFDGLATYREVLRIRPGQRAIIVTGFSASDNVQEAQRLGAGACLKKPYTLDSIARALRDELDTVKVRKVRQPVTTPLERPFDLLPVQ
jgi:two-component system, cell cycle sensor histidine kinase and response regulator CckA